MYWGFSLYQHDTFCACISVGINLFTGIISATRRHLPAFHVAKYNYTTAHTHTHARTHIHLHTHTHIYRDVFLYTIYTITLSLIKPLLPLTSVASSRAVETGIVLAYTVCSSFEVVRRQSKSSAFWNITPTKKVRIVTYSQVIKWIASDYIWNTPVVGFCIYICHSSGAKNMVDQMHICLNTTHLFLYPTYIPVWCFFAANFMLGTS